VRAPEETRRSFLPSFKRPARISRFISDKALARALKDLARILERFSHDLSAFSLFLRPRDFYLEKFREEARAKWEFVGILMWPLRVRQFQRASHLLLSISGKHFARPIDRYVTLEIAGCAHLFSRSIHRACPIVSRDHVKRNYSRRVLAVTRIFRRAAHQIVTKA